MKRILACFILIGSISVSVGQTLVASIDLDLKKPAALHQVDINSNRETNEFYIFASDKSRITALKFNSALFMRDSLTTSRPSEIYDFIAGQCFSSGGNAEVYWMSENHKQIFGMQFDFENKVASTSAHQISYDKQTYVSHFSTNNAFYVVTVDNDDANLILHEFKSAQMNQQVLNFSETGLVKTSDKPTALRALLEEHALVMIDTESLNPLFYCTAKIKYYLSNGKLYITADHQLHETIVVEVNLADFSVNYKHVAQSHFEKPGKANSYLINNKLYQIKANEDRLEVKVTDNVTAQDSIIIANTKQSEITEKNSPFLSQTARQTPRQIKNTERFLRALSSSLPGISIYQTPDSKLVTIGGISYVASSSDILLGVAAGVGMVLTGTDLYLDGLVPNDNLRTVFYETHLDEQNRFVKKEQEILAADKLSRFFEQQKGTSLMSVVPYRGYFIAGYYVEKENKFYLRKFSDGFDD